MKRFMLPVLLPVVVILAAGCGGGSNSGSAGTGTGETVVTGAVQSCFGDSMRVFEYRGANLKKVAAGKLDKGDDGNYSFSLSMTVPGPGIYLIGPDQRTNTGIVIAPGEKVEFSGNCSNIQGSASFTGSPLNDAYSSFMQDVSRYQNNSNRLMQNMQAFQFSDPSQLGRIQEELNQANEQYFGYLDSVIAAGGFIGKVAAMYNFKPFMSDPAHSEFSDETDYFKKAFYKGVDLGDEALNHIPQLVDKTKYFAATMASRGIPQEEATQLFEQYLGQTPDGSLARRLFYQGILDGFDQVKSDLYVTFGKKFAAEYGNDPMASMVTQRVASMEAFKVGSEAPEIEGENPEGKNIKLTSLRGNVVLVDFWASWCRPCRMENPNVKKAYAKYKSKGFEILGVSLDNKKDKWVQAIEQDGLPWKHVSDLQGWQSAHAALYGVNSIPATFLLDKDGNILAKNLRGPALESKLEEIFGS